MNDVTTLLSALKRPRLLIRAARFGLDDYNRTRDLKRLLRESVPPSPLKAISNLIAQEARLEETRQSGDASYSVARHVDVLIALMAEARLIPRADQAGA